MGEDRIARVAQPAREIQDVDVDLARAVRERGRAPHPELDFPRPPQALARRPAPGDLDDGVPEIRLVAEADRLRAVERGDPSQGSEGGDLAKSGFEMGAPVAEVGSEAEVRDAEAALREIATFAPLRRI